MYYDVIDKTFEAQLNDLAGLISIPSVSRGTPEPGAPLGRSVSDALEYTRALARKLGFPNSRSLDGRCRPEFEHV